MTTKNTLIETLLSEAREKARIIIDDANIKVKKTLKESQLKGIEDSKEEIYLIETKAINETAIQTLSITASTEIKAKWKILEKKNELINAVLEDVNKELLLLTKREEYFTILENLIIEGAILIGKQGIFLELNEQDSNLPLDLSKIAQIIYEKSNIKVKIVISSKSLNTKGGVIIKSAKEKLIVNNTFEEIIKNNERELRFKIAQILFN